MSRKSDRLMASVVLHDAKTPLSVFKASLNDDDVDIIGVDDLNRKDKEKVEEFTGVLDALNERLDEVDDIRFIEKEAEYLSTFSEADIEGEAGKYIQEVAEISSLVEDYIKDVNTSDGAVELDSILYSLEKEGRVSYDVEPTSEVQGDPGLCMVASTLAMNSSDHNSDEEEPDIWAEVKEKEESYQIQIWDDGDGLSEEYDPEEIFEKGVGENTGLGLYLARELTELFDGSLEYSQENAEKEEGFGIMWELKKPGQYVTPEPL